MKFKESDRVYQVGKKKGQPVLVPDIKTTDDIPDKVKKFFDEGYTFLEQLVGKENIVYAEVHYDEDTPPEDDKKQVDIVSDLLGNSLDMKVAKFTSEETAEQRDRLKVEFDEGESLQALIAIRCFAPMAGISNTSYRKIIKSMGCGLIYAEMVSDKAITYGNSKTIELLKMSDEERPIAQQIFGSDVDSFVAAAKRIEELMHPDIIDINMGCPVPKVALRAQAGASLLKNPEKIYTIVKSVVDAVSVPVTVKIRSGWDENHINAVEVAKCIEKAGASAITIHARTRSAGYSGHAAL